MFFIFLSFVLKGNKLNFFLFFDGCFLCGRVFTVFLGIYVFVRSVFWKVFRGGCDYYVVKF